MTDNDGDAIAETAQGFLAGHDLGVHLGHLVGQTLDDLAERGRHLNAVERVSLYRGCSAIFRDAADALDRAAHGHATNAWMAEVARKIAEAGTRNDPHPDEG